VESIPSGRRRPGPYPLERLRRVPYPAVRIGNSIPRGAPQVQSGYENWRSDAETCARFCFTNPSGLMCGRCTKACPWNKQPGRLHDAVRRVVQRTPVFDRFFVKMDRVFGYGRQVIEDKWWLDEG